MQIRFPKISLLLFTVLAKPLRLTHDQEHRQEVYDNHKHVLLPVKELLGDPVRMEKLLIIRNDELERLYDLKLMRHKIQIILEDPMMFQEDIKNNLNNIDLSKIKKKEQEAHRANLNSQRYSLTEDIEKYHTEGIMRDRLIAVLKEANAVKTLKIDE